MAMASTSPDNISYLTSGSAIDPVAESSNQATSVQTALSNRPFYNYVWNTATDRTNQTGMRAGDTGYEVDTNTAYQYFGSTLGWNLSPMGVGRMLSGQVTVTVSGTASPYKGTASITFPTGYFASTPTIVTCAITAGPTIVNSSAANPTASGFALTIARTDSAINTGANWIAVL